MAEKSKIEIFLMPLVIAAVGTIGTYLITQQQIKSTSSLQEVQRKQTQENAKLEQQIKILEIFSKNIVSQQEHEKKIALNVLNALLDSELAKKLATAVSDAESNQSTQKTVQQVADRVVEEAEARTNLLPRIYIPDYSDASFQRAFMTISGICPMKVLHTQGVMNTHHTLLGSKGVSTGVALRQRL